MADLQTINIGNLVNDGLGDDLRTAFQKVNANFTDLNAELAVIGVNTGTTGVGVYKEKVGGELRFKKLVSGTKMLLDERDDNIVVNSTAPDAFERIDTNAGTVSATSFTNITLQGGDDIDVTALGGIISVNNVIPVTHILTYYDFGPITGAYENSMQVAMQASNIDFGTLTYTSRLNVDAGGLS
jgi:hypothetical protein